MGTLGRDGGIYRTLEHCHGLFWGIMGELVMKDRVGAGLRGGGAGGGLRGGGAVFSLHVF